MLREGLLETLCEVLQAAFETSILEEAVRAAFVKALSESE